MQFKLGILLCLFLGQFLWLGADECFAANSWRAIARPIRHKRRWRLSRLRLADYWLAFSKKVKTSRTPEVYWMEMESFSEPGEEFDESETGSLLRSQYDPEYKDDYRYLMVSIERNSVKWDVGFQEVTWGNTFGVNISDVVNPHDDRDSYADNLAWTQVPTCLINTQTKLGKFSVQGIFTPAPPSDRLPEGLAVSKPDEMRFRHFAEISEFGGKVDYLFDNGLNSAVFYYHHWNRNIVSQKKPEKPAQEKPTPTAKAAALDVMEPSPSTSVDASTSEGKSEEDEDDEDPFDRIYERVHTLGWVSSKSFGSKGQWRLRSDHVVTFAEPQVSEAYGTSTRQDHFRNIVGADYTEGDWTLGLQYHADWIGRAQLDWASILVKRKMLGGKFETQFYMFSGLTNPDLWLQPRISWSPSEEFSVSLRGDLIWSGLCTDGILGATAEENKVVSWLSYRM